MGIKKIAKVEKLELEYTKANLDQLRGNIISAATVIESALGWYLRRYFFPKTNMRATIFYWYIINTRHFSFDKKILLYEQIPYFKKLKRYIKVKNSLRFIQKLRNAIAHWELDEKMSDGLLEIVVYNPVTLERLKLTPKLMVEFKEHEKYLLKIFGWKQTLKRKYG